MVGGGPAGLTAAIYLARFRLTVRVLDGGDSRADLIPCTRNLSGFPAGIAGPDLLARMRRQAGEFDVELQRGRVQALEKAGEIWSASGDFPSLSARSVLLATGVSNRRPVMDEAMHAQALSQGQLRYCPVCDGFEVTDQNVGVIGTGEHGVREALFLRAYTARVTLVANDGVHDLTDAQRAQLGKVGIETLDGPVGDFQLGPASLSLRCAANEVRTFDTVYPALGSTARSELASSLGAETSADGCIKVGAHQRTSIAGLYAAGDVVLGLDQISHAMGEASVAATAIRNDLAERAPMLR